MPLHKRLFLEDIPLVTNPFVSGLVVARSTRSIHLLNILEGSIWALLHDNFLQSEINGWLKKGTTWETSVLQIFWEIQNPKFNDIFFLQFAIE
jgi:hypothetical protein